MLDEYIIHSILLLFILLFFIMNIVFFIIMTNKLSKITETKQEAKLIEYKPSNAKKMSDEQRRKISESQKKRWEKKKAGKSNPA